MANQQEWRYDPSIGFRRLFFAFKSPFSVAYITSTC